MKKIVFSLTVFSLAFNSIIYAQDQGGSYKAYNNYDFVAGESILFEDNFNDDADGEFPAHWQLTGGQAVVNKMENDKIVAITKYYTVVAPRMKTANYLPSEYTIEFDQYLDANYDSNPGVGVGFTKGGDRPGVLTIDHSHITLEYPGGKLQGDMPSAIASEAFHNKWHHIAIAVKNKQIKVYCDQYRVLVVPDCNFATPTLCLWGNASEGMNMMFRNFKLAKGGGMNMVGKKFTDAKIVTHGIRFDVNSANIKPESMGVINIILQIMKDNPELKFEIGGHTDTDGSTDLNLKLSQQRAEAVRTQLVSMGISEGRLTAKGYGKSKPIADNSSTEGKANNRRVEFVKI